MLWPGGPLPLEPISFRTSFQSPSISSTLLLRALGEHSVFRGRELALKPIQETIEYQALSFIEHSTFDSSPEAALGENSGEERLGSVNRSAEATEEPLRPRGDVHGPFLGCLERVVVGAALS